MIKKANISDCGKYRYTLERVWDIYKPTVCFIMLNPSTADADRDDNTVTRCINFAKAWGYGKLIIVNLFPFRATKPKELIASVNPFGHDNAEHVAQAIERSKLVVCAWGNQSTVDKLLKRARNQDLPFVRLRRTTTFTMLEASIKGTPKHPLYLRGDLKPFRWIDATPTNHPLNRNI